MSIATKAAGVLLAATALCGFASLASVADADTPTQAAGPTAGVDAGSPQKVQYSRGFHVTNLSSNPIKLLSVSGQNDWEGRAPDGSILPPGAGYQDFEMTWIYQEDTFNTLNYAMLDGQGNTIATFHYLIAVGGETGSTGSQFHVDSGNITGDANNTTQLDVKDAANTVRTINGDQAQAQAQTLKQFCASTNSATCSFTPTSETTVDGPSHVLVTETNNGTAPAQLTATNGDTVTSTDSVDISATLGGNIAGIVDASVTGSYGHTWSTGHSFSTGVSNTVPAGYFGEITAIAPMIRDTGNFTISIGNTTINLNGVYFDTPNPDGAEHFGYDQHPLTQQQLNTVPKAAVVTVP